MSTSNAALLEALVNLLSQNLGKPVKNDDLATSLQINPTLLGRQLQTLRKNGYLIDADGEQNIVLRQMPDRLKAQDIQAYLKTSFIGHDVHYFSELDSGLDKAFDLAQHYPAEDESMTPLRRSPKFDGKGAAFAGNGSVVVSEVSADEGNSGAEALCGTNLHCAVVLRPGILPTRAPQIALVACVALARVVESYSGVRPSLQWPNVLLAKGRTLAQIEVKMQSNIEKINFLILGFRVNLNGQPDDSTVPAKECDTSVRGLSGKSVNRPQFAASLFRELEKWYVTYINKGPEKIIREIQHFFPIQNKEMHFVACGKSYSGVVEGLDTDGALLLRTSGGKVERVAAGNIPADVFP